MSVSMPEYGQSRVCPKILAETEGLVFSGGLQTWDTGTTLSLEEVQCPDKCPGPESDSSRWRQVLGLAKWTCGYTADTTPSRPANNQQQ